MTSDEEAHAARPRAIDEIDPDWVRRWTWDLPDNAPDLREHLFEIGVTVEQFKRSEAYTARVDSMPWLRRL